jgi:CubicO group peptidase (beta-lactamase class C family)
LKPIDESLLQDALAYVDRWIEYRQRTLAVPGVAIAVGLGDRVVLSRAYGLADVERGTPLTTGHSFRIASQSKMFTATALMRMVERGLLSLDERIGERLPWLPAQSRQIGRVTVAQLMSHSGGVIRDGASDGFWQLERDFPAAEELRSGLSELPLVFPPNLQFKYSNFGYGLLGMLIERVAGEPYNAHVQREVVDRLGLPNTGPEIDDHAREHLATGYTGNHYGLERLPVEHIDTRALSPATGFYSTAEDLCRFGAAHFLGREELLSDESKREMQRPRFEIDGVPHPNGRSYGLGMVIFKTGERRLVGHGGSLPGFTTNIKLDPEDELVMVALTNASGGPAPFLTEGMVSIVNRALEAEPASNGQTSASIDRFVGRYFSIAGALDVVRFGGQLLGINPEMSDPMDGVTELTVEGPDRLRICKAPGYASPGEQMRFFFDGAGRVKRVQAAAALTLYPWEPFKARMTAGGRGGSPVYARPMVSGVSM